MHRLAVVEFEGYNSNFGMSFINEDAANFFLGGVRHCDEFILLVWQSQPKMYCAISGCEQASVFPHIKEVCRKPSGYFSSGSHLTTSYNIRNMLLNNRQNKAQNYTKNLFLFY